jgi:ketosteroid isomerase-like protein
MSQENVELGYRALDAINRRDLGAYLALMDDDVQAAPRVAGMEGGFRGHEGIRRWWGNLFDIFPDFMVDVAEVRDLGDVTLAALDLRASGAGGETPVNETIWNVVRWRSGRCTWWGIFQTQGEALEAAGLSG